MVDDAARLGELLKLPNLEEDTIKLINAVMRDQIEKIKAQAPVTQENLVNVIDEYLNGAKKGGA